MNKKFRNVVSVATAALLATTAVGYSVLSKNEKTVSADNTEEKKTIESTISENVTFTTTGEDKEETVYVISDANGNVTKTIVSDWLKNRAGSDTLEDKTDLTNIENVKSDADYKEGKDGNITWAADGADIYYQGETDKELPVDVKVTYYLDGKEIMPADLAGKSGKVKIRFDYTNREKRELMVNGSKEDIYVPFTMVSGMILDGNNFSNVEVSSGKVISDGKRYIVVGLAFPGLDEDLNMAKLSERLEEEVSFPDYVEVTCDAKEFSLGLTVTMGSADLISQVNTDAANSLDDVEELINKLVSATDELKSGTSKLKDGLSELKNSFVAYADGEKNLTSGLTQINDGVSQLDAKTPELTDGMKSLLDGVDEIISKVSGDGGAVAGADQLADGAAQVDAGVGELKNQSSALIDGIEKLAAGSSTVEENMNTAVSAFADQNGQPGLTSGSQAVADGVAELEEQLTGMVQTINASIADNNAKIEQCKAGIEKCQGGIQSYADGISQTQQGIDQCNALLAAGVNPQTGAALSEQEIAGYTAKVADLTANIEMYTTESQKLAATIEELKSNIAQLSGANAALTQVLQGMNPESMTSSLNTLKDGADKVAGGVGKVEAGLKQLESEGTSQVASGLAQLNEKVPALSEGIDKLKAGTSQVAGGAAQLASGMHTLDDAITNTLRPGVDKLYQGGLLFKSSISQLYEGTKKAAAGGSELDNGTQKVTEGIAKLYDGSVQLDDGMGQFKEEAVDKIQDFAEKDLKEVTDRIKATTEAAADYTIFSDAAEGKSTSVKFIYETAGIE